MMKERLQEIRERALEQINSTDSLEKLNEVRVSILGKKGELNALMEEFKTVAPELKREMGQQLNKLNKQLGGIRNMNRTPSAMFVVDITKEALAVEEAHKLGIPVVAIVDTNADPDTVEYPIPANDDAIRGIELLTSLMADAVAEGLLERSGANKAEGEAAEQPMAAWEKELLTNEAPAEASAEAAAPAAAEGETAEAPKAE